MTNIISTLLFIALFILTTIQDRQHKKYKKCTNEYIETLKEGIAIRDEKIITVIDNSNYYKKAYEDTIMEHINLLKIINKKNKIGGNTNE